MKHKNMKTIWKR